MFFPSFLALLSLLSLVFAVPVSVRKPIPHALDVRKPPSLGLGGHGSSFVLGGNCSTSNATMNLPSGQTNLTVPSGQSVEAIMLGRGTQNYTCTNGAYTSVGALASLYDVSCLASVLPSSAFYSLPQMAVQLPNPLPAAPSSWGLPADFSIEAKGKHYFINDTSPAGLEPKFDFTAGSGNAADTSLYVTASKTGTLSAPSSPTTNVAWLQLTSIAGQGDFASSVFRIDTASGQPASTCSTPGQAIEVQYSALYYFYK